MLFITSPSRNHEIQKFSVITGHFLPLRILGSSYIDVFLGLCKSITIIGGTEACFIGPTSFKVVGNFKPLVLNSALKIRGILPKMVRVGFYWGDSRKANKQCKNKFFHEVN